MSSKKSSKKSKLDLALPLDYLYPDEFGEMDEGEEELICEYNALDLVLLENASELFRMAVQEEGVIEKILKTLVEAYSEDNPKLHYLYSNTFPFYVSQNLKNKFYKSDTVSSINKEREYRKNVKNYRKHINPNKDYVSVVAVDLEEFGGHYAAFHYSNGVVTLFDSMQANIPEKEKKLYPTTIKSSSYYTPYFSQLVSDIFPGATVNVPDCIKDELSLQYTGGFPETLPYSLERQKVPAKLKKLLKMQSTESQNHFCYLWSIWWLHLKLMGLKFQNILGLFKNNDPLIVIKKYGWCILQILKIKTEYPEFFKKHFMSIWSNGQDRLSPEFRRYDISVPSKCENINDALLQSVEKFVLNPVSNTPIPRELC